MATQPTDEAEAYALAFDQLADAADAEQIAYSQAFAQLSAERAKPIYLSPAGRAPLAVGTAGEWAEFSAWAATQGGELARFAATERIDRYSAEALRQQLSEALPAPVVRYAATPPAAAPASNGNEELAATLRTGIARLVVAIDELRPLLQRDPAAERGRVKRVIHRDASGLVKEITEEPMA